MIITQEWYKKARERKKQADDYNLSTLERHKAQEAFFDMLKEVQVEEIATKPKEELQYLPFPWALDALHINGFGYELTDAIEKRYKELGLYDMARIAREEW